MSQSTSTLPPQALLDLIDQSTLSLQEARLLYIDAQRKEFDSPNDLNKRILNLSRRQYETCLELHERIMKKLS